PLVPHGARRDARGRQAPSEARGSRADLGDQGSRGPAHGVVGHGREDLMSSNRGYEVLFQRHAGNPILSAADWHYPAHTVFNAGATLLRDGTTLLLCRVEDRRGHSHLCAARSKNGVDGWI